ncbi:MAG TPA: hypothetical protein VEX57_06990 [Microlunatus sp.]|nr:hypothetical protein [Microlunatus sp.]
MTQSPLGHDPSQAGPFDGPGPGEPDLPTTQQDLTTTQGASVPEDPALSPTAYPGEDGPTGGAYQTGGTYQTSGTYQTGGAQGGSSSGLGQTSGTGSSDTGSRAETAKGEAKQVAGTAAESAKQVAETARSEVGNVATEAKQQAVSLLDTVRSEVGSQAGTQQNRIADALHGLAKELGGMASASDQSGPLTDLAQQASRKGGEVAHWLQDREPADVLESVRSYGRRHPVTFLALCGLAGIVAGRLTRSTVATRTSLDNKDGGGSGTEGRGGTYVAQRAAAPYASQIPSPYGSGPADPAPYGTGPEFAAPYANQPVNPGPYGSASVDRAPYGSEPPMPGSAFVGTTEPSADPNVGPAR